MRFRVVAVLRSIDARRDGCRVPHGRAATTRGGCQSAAARCGCNQGPPAPSSQTAGAHHFSVDLLRSQRVLLYSCGGMPPIRLVNNRGRASGRKTLASNLGGDLCLDATLPGGVFATGRRVKCRVGTSDVAQQARHQASRIDATKRAHHCKPEPVTLDHAILQLRVGSETAWPHKKPAREPKAR